MNAREQKGLTIKTFSFVPSPGGDGVRHNRCTIGDLRKKLFSRKINLGIVGREESNFCSACTRLVSSFSRKCAAQNIAEIAHVAFTA